MKKLNLATAIAMTTLLENGGKHAGVIYSGAARDAEGRQFLLAENQYPVGFSCDAEGDIVLNSERLKGAVKFSVEVGHSLRDAFNAYCAQHKLNDGMYFQMSSVELAMTLATMSNIVRHASAMGDSASEEDVVQESVIATLTQLGSTVSKMDPTMLNDEDSLVQAMIAAGMTPVRGEGVATVQEASAETPEATPVANVVRIEEAPLAKPKKADKEEELARAEKLAAMLRNSDSLNDDEKTMLEHLENIIEVTRTRQATLKSVLSDRTSTMSRMRAHMLTGRGAPMGLQLRYTA